MILTIFWLQISIIPLTTLVRPPSAVPNLFGRAKIKVKKASKPWGKDKSADEEATEQVPMGVPIALFATGPAAGVPAWDVEPSVEEVEGGYSRRPDKRPRVEEASHSPPEHVSPVPRSSLTRDPQDQSYLGRDPALLEH